MLKVRIAVWVEEEKYRAIERVQIKSFQSCGYSFNWVLFSNLVLVTMSDDSDQDGQVTSSGAPPPASIHSNPTPATAEVMEDEFVVEKILDKRISKGHVYYLIKWQGFSDQDNTWEPEENLADCPELIVDFETRSKDQSELATVDPVAAVEQDIPLPMNNFTRAMMNETGNIEGIGFNRGLEADAIYGATDCGGELCFLMKWIGK